MEIRGAILEIKPVRQISEKFSVQEIYLDTSNYNNMTGERYDNATMVQNINSKVNVNGLKRGDVVDLKVYLNGRFFTRKDGAAGFMQSFNLASISRAANTSGDAIVFPEDQLLQVEIPE